MKYSDMKEHPSYQETECVHCGELIWTSDLIRNDAYEWYHGRSDNAYCITNPPMMQIAIPPFIEDLPL